MIVILELEDFVEEIWNDFYVVKVFFELGCLFYIMCLKNGLEIFVEFFMVKNIEVIIVKVWELFGEKIIIMLWFVYVSRFNKDVLEIVEMSNMFLLLENDN